MLAIVVYRVGGSKPGLQPNEFGTEFVWVIRDGSLVIRPMADFRKWHNIEVLQAVPSGRLY